MLTRKSRGNFLLTMAALGFLTFSGQWLKAQDVRLAKQTKAGQDAGVKEERIRAALDTRVDVSLIEVPLHDVAKQIEMVVGFDVELDTKALDVVGIGGDTPITRELSDVSLRSALNLMLDELELTYVIANEVLLITTFEEADANLWPKVYDVADLVAPANLSVAGSPFAVNPPEPNFIALTRVITTTIAPDTWDQVGGPGSIESMAYGEKYVLVISQTEEVHEEVRELLEQIRSVKPRRVVDPKVEKDGVKADRIIVKLYPVNERYAEKTGELAELLRETVAAGTWDESDGKLLLGKANVILVKHHPAVHQQIREVLQGIRATGSNGGEGKSNSSAAGDESKESSKDG